LKILNNHEKNPNYSAEEIIDILFKTGISIANSSTNPVNAISEIKITKKNNCKIS